MSIDTLNREMWSLDQAYQHIRKVRRLYHERLTGEKVVLTPADIRKVFGREEGSDNSIWSRINRNSTRQLHQSLRQGVLHALGRLSKTRNPDWPHLDGQEWIFHSLQPIWIVPEHWINGYYHAEDGSFPERLELADGEYIDLQVPRFMVEAIWPLPLPKQIPSTDYTTPYLELIKAAIAEFQITENDQSKKECLVDWFKEQQVEGEPVSDNLAKAMATIMRLPASQRGGGKRSW